VPLIPARPFFARIRRVAPDVQITRIRLSPASSGLRARQVGATER
jgi:hypothetical protein